MRRSAPTVDPKAAAERRAFARYTARLALDGDHDRDADHLTDDELRAAMEAIVGADSELSPQAIRDLARRSLDAFEAAEVAA